MQTKLKADPHPHLCNEDNEFINQLQTCMFALGFTVRLLSLSADTVGPLAEKTSKPLPCSLNLSGSLQDTNS